MKWSIAAYFLSVALLAWSSSTVAQSLSDPGLQLTTVLNSAAGLRNPTGMSFLGNNPNDFFAIEKDSGRVKRFQSGTSTTVLDLPVESESERGLLGIALHPNFGEVGMPNNDKVYLYYSRSSTGHDSSSSHWKENRLSQFDWNGSSLASERVLATFGKAGDHRSSGPNHNGGPIKFGPDGMLYGITGDLNRRLAEQNVQSAGGKSSRVGVIFRLTDSGQIPSDNPYRSSANASFRRVYAYGVRNSFGLDFDPANGRLWDTENGATAYDEINQVLRGSNSGWTDLMGPNSRSAGSVSGLYKIASTSRYSDPEFSWKDPVAVTSIHFLYGSNLGAAYDNKVLVGDANNGNLYMFTLNTQRSDFMLNGNLSDKVADTDAQRNRLRIGTGFGITTDILRGPDDKTYVLNFASGEVYRIDASLEMAAAIVPEPSTAIQGIIACGVVVMFVVATGRRRNKSQTVTLVIT
ncbi:MAG: PQQ-dependent sugar dehydrogenase [Pirellulales bacterium]|nr:PQQ-dependent sugar dehydrogenase [Pirellulales bacterium]